MKIIQIFNTFHVFGVHILLPGSPFWILADERSYWGWLNACSVKVITLKISMKFFWWGSKFDLILQVYETLVPNHWNQTTVFGSKSIHWKKGRSAARVPEGPFSTPAWSILEWYNQLPNLVCKWFPSLVCISSLYRIFYIKIKQTKSTFSHFRQVRW